MIKFEEGEKIIHIARRHWFVMLGVILFIAVLALAPLIFLKFFPIAQILEWFGFIYPLWLLLLWTFLFVEWTDYYLDVWIITNRRIIDVEQKGFFNREITSFGYNQVQDITVETKGLIETIFKFGLLHVQTAGHSRDIIIPHADKPEEVRSIILRQQNFTS